MWHMGKKLKAMAPSANGTRLRDDNTLLTIFLWDNMTPFGFPVVPEV